jgi:AraC-like DNA-binding protein
MDFMVASSFSFVREHTTNRITPLKMGFNFEEPDNAERYRELFQPAIVEFGHPQSFLIYRESDFNDSIVNPSNELHEQFKIMLEAAISEHDNYQKYTRQVRQHIQKGLKAEIPLVEDIAAAMAMSVRSLQQHLKEEGTSYQKLLNEVRKDVSVNQLKNKNLNISDVAFLTGFSDISIFSRNFKKWTGLTPSQFQLEYA